LVGRFKGLGRAKGFRLLGRSSGLGDEDLCRAVKAKVLTVLQTLASHGYVEAEEILKAVGMRDVTHRLGEERRYYEVEIDHLERQVKAEQRARQDAEAELADLELRLSKVKSERHRTTAAIDEALRKLRVVARDVEHGAMLEESLSDTFEELEEAIEVLHAAAADADRDDARDNDS